VSEWQPIETIPRDGSRVIVKLSTGREVEAEYWDGPDEHPDWGGWAWNGTPSFCAGTTRKDSDAEWTGWKRAPDETVSS
jgi:hypothetical protein